MKMTENSDRYSYWFISMAIVMFFFIAVRFLGSSVTLLLAPIVAWGVWTLDARWYPALLLSMSVDGYNMYAYLLMSLIISVKNWRKFNAYPQVVKGLLFFLLIPVPVLIAFCVRNWLYLDGVPSKAVEPMTMYLGVFPFFFGVLIARQISRRDAWSVLCVCILLAGMQFVTPFSVEGDRQETIRVVFLTIPVVVCCVVYGLMKRQFLVITLFGFFVILGYILTGKGNTFTILVSSLWACILVFFVRFRFKGLIKCATSFFPFALSMIFVAFVAITFEKYALQSYDRTLIYEEFAKQWNWEAIKIRAQIKTYDDRAALWRATWGNVSKTPYWVPDVITENVVFETVSGDYIESELSAHNQPLQVLRTLRWGVGSFLIIGYLFISVLGGRYLRLPVKTDNPMLPIMAATVAVAIIGFTTGHYPLIPTFSFMFTSFLGIGYGLYCQEIHMRRMGINAP